MTTIYILILLNGFTGQHFVYTAAPIYENLSICEKVGAAINEGKGYRCVKIPK